MISEDKGAFFWYIYGLYGIIFNFLFFNMKEEAKSFI